MPHIIVEYTREISEQIDMSKLVEALHNLAITLPALPTGGIRTRAYCADVNRVADGGADRQFIYMTIRLGQGRSADVKRDIGEKLFAVLTDFTKAHFTAGKPLSLGLEIQEIEKEWTWKKNNIHQILKDKEND